MFLKHNDNKIVNLINVSNIYVDFDKHKDNSGKVIFNMNYSVKVFGDRFTSDYVYWYFSSVEELVSIENIIKSSIDKSLQGWITPVEENQRYINIACVSSIVVDDNKNRIIFNLNYNVTNTKKKEQLTSDFVFMDFLSKNSYMKHLNYVLDELMYTTN